MPGTAAWRDKRGGRTCGPDAVPAPCASDGARGAGTTKEQRRGERAQRDTHCADGRERRSALRRGAHQVEDDNGGADDGGQSGALQAVVAVNSRVEGAERARRCV